MATLKTANLEIYIYTGTSGSYSSTDLKYTLQKQIIEVFLSRQSNLKATIDEFQFSLQISSIKTIQF